MGTNLQRFVMMEILNVFSSSVIYLPNTLYSTIQTDVTESAQSDFERVHPNEFDTFTREQDERRVEYDNICVSLVDSKSGFDQSKCKLTDFCTLQLEKVKEMGISLKKKK